MMKNFMSLTILTFIYLSCSAQIQDYKIEGTNKSGTLEGRYVYLNDPDKGKNVDSTIIKNGKFLFTGQTEGSLVRSINMEKHASIKFVLECGNIAIDMDNYSIAGTPLNNILNDCNVKIKEIRKKATENYSDKDLIRINEITAEVDRKSLEVVVPYIKTNKENALTTLLILNVLSTSNDVETFKTLKSLAGQYTLDFRPFLYVSRKFEALSNTQAGMPFIDFTIKNGNIDGTPVSLSDFVGKGKYILVDFWASWCRPCRAEIPNIEKVYKEFKGDKFDVLSIAVWDVRENTIKAAKEHNITWNQIIDAQKVPTDLYGISGIPQIYLFGPDGKIVAKDLRGDNIRAKVSEVLSK